MILWTIWYILIKFLIVWKDVEAEEDDILDNKDQDEMGEYEEIWENIYYLFT